MAEQAPSVTVVIAARPGQSDIIALPACRLLEYPAERLEILVTRGKQPSAQRNAALKAAHGDLIYFLDDDSVPQPGNLRRAVPLFRTPEVQMAGGPNLCPPESPWLEQVFAMVLGSWLAFGPSRARYRRLGPLRETSEKELILCNQMARRATMLELGGFNEALYPNEENALMDELQKSGGKLMYDPDFFVHRRPRRSLQAFAKMLLTYGRGRAEQFRLHPTPGSALNFVPPAFVLYLAIFVVVFAFLPAYAKTAAWPLAAYAAALLVQFLLLAQGGKVLGCLAATPLIALSNILYGLGFWRGLFTRLRPAGARAPVPVELEVIQPLPQGTDEHRYTQRQN